MLGNNFAPFNTPLYGKNNNWRNLQQINPQQINPQEIELMMKQKFNPSYCQGYTQGYNNYENDPYIELQQLIGECSTSVRQRIVNDIEYKKCDEECELLIKQAIEDIIIPQLLMTPQGRIAFEKFTGTVKKLKEKYSMEELENNKKIQVLMEDEIVKKRLEELGRQGGMNNVE